MKLLTFLAATIAVASAGQIYSGQPIENYSGGDIYQSQVDYQQHGGYVDQSQAYAPQHSGRPLAEKTARILNHQQETNAHGYQFVYETENGIKAQEIGQSSGGGVAAQGGYSYTGDDGQVYTVTYTADEHGFHPQGAHLPTSPPIPEAILKSLEQNAKDEAAGIYDDGNYKEQHHAAAPAYQQYEQPSYQQDFHQAGQDYQQAGQDYHQAGQDYHQAGQDYHHAGQEFHAQSSGAEGFQH